MYYEEKIIDGILHFRGTPNGDWIECNLIQLTSKLINARNYNNDKSLEQLEKDMQLRQELQDLAQKRTNEVNELFNYLLKCAKENKVPDHTFLNKYFD